MPDAGAYITAGVTPVKDQPGKVNVSLNGTTIYNSTGKTILSKGATGTYAATIVTIGGTKFYQFMRQGKTVLAKVSAKSLQPGAPKYVPPASSAKEGPSGSKGQTSRPGAIAGPSSSSTGSGTVGGVLPSLGGTLGTTSPLAILAIGAGVFLVIVLLARHKGKR